MTLCDNDAITDLWHPVMPVAEMTHGEVGAATLLGQLLSYTLSEDGEPRFWRSGSPDEPVLVQVEYLYVWVCLGTPSRPVFEMPEFAEDDRRNLHAGTIGVHVSAPRAIENFLDMGHFPFVHTDILGEEPHTEVAEYETHVDPETDEVWATDCVFWQPVAATTSTQGQLTDYRYRVPHPYCVILYKTTPVDPDRMDVIALFCRAVDEDYIEAHMFLCLIDDVNSDAVIRRFQQTIFAQDKPILENQYPKLLPLDPRAETPIRADKVAIAYRRWLSDLGVTYGVIPAA